MTDQHHDGAHRAYDVAIVGAGPAGSATAAHLARVGRRVALLDHATFPRDKPCAEYLSPAVEPLLADLGVLDVIAETGPVRLRGFRVYTADGRMFQGDFAGAGGGRSDSRFETGLVVTRRVLDAELVRAATVAGAHLYQGCRVSRFSREPGSRLWSVTAGGGDTQRHIAARLLIGADGVHSLVARRLGLRRDARTRKVAIVAHIRGIEALSEYGEMHIANHRYVGVAPLEPGGDGALCNVALVVDERREGKALAGRPQEHLLDALATFPCLRDRVSSLCVARPALTTSRMCVRVRRRSIDGAVLVGDAAGYYDPFTGEGIYRALRSAELAAGVICRALAEDDPSVKRLSEYDRMYAAEFRGKLAVEMAIQAAVQTPLLMGHVAARLEKHKRLADTLVGVTGDFLSPGAVLRPSFLLRLML
jgi:flavin-dependent dehydrogenase